jgi:hypothetical protein
LQGFPITNPSSRRNDYGGYRLCDMMARFISLLLFLPIVILDFTPRSTMPSEPEETAAANGNGHEVDETSRLLPPSADDEVEHEGPRIKISRLRGVALGISLWIMILTQSARTDFTLQRMY